MKYIRRFLVLFLVVILGLAFNIGISKAEEPTVYKIGAILPLTGTLSEIGENAKKGILLALAEANKQYKAKGIEFEVLLEDTKTSPKDAVNALNKLINVDRVGFVIGPISSGATLAVAPIAESNGVILISPGASSPELSEAGDYIFRTWHSTSYEGRMFAEHLHKTLRTKSIGVLFINNEYGIGLLDEFTKTFKSLDGKILFQEAFQQNRSDFRPILSKIKPISKQVDGIYIIGYHNETGALLRQSKEMMINARFFCSDANQDPKLIEIAGSAAEGLIYPHAKKPDITIPYVSDFQSGYRKKFGEEYGTTSDTAYDAFNLLSLAILRYGYNPLLAKTFLLNTKGYNGASGTISFDSHGDVLKEFEIKTVKNGKFVIY